MKQLWMTCGFLVACAVGLTPGCSKPKEGAAAATAPPNILWVVWDTTRADRLSLYGYPKPTTPNLDVWAKDATVFENCVSTAGSTVPSHASMFTGLLPSEHGTHNGHQWLDDSHRTIAEILRDRGYQTFLYSANPHISRAENFQQGFQTAEHPWDAKYRQEALRIVRDKVSPQDRSSELAEKVRRASVGNWDIKASGELAQRATLEWLQKRDASKPFFVFLNYMEAHRPFVPPEKFRRRMMTEAQLPRSYEIDRSWVTMWSYCFGLHEYSQEELDVMAATYDACVAELDELFASLLEGLERAGALENTVVVLTADHGEHLGEHHMLDHQYTLYQPLIHVPLVVHYPARFAPGREKRPVMTFDLFPTLLELAGAEAPSNLNSKAVSLLSPRADRQRLSEYPSVFLEPFMAVKAAHPTWDPAPWHRTMRALFAGDAKYIWQSDGKHELYDLPRDPGEQDNLITKDSATAGRMAGLLDAFVATLRMAGPSSQPVPGMSEEIKQHLRALGYLADPPAEKGATTRPKPRPATRPATAPARQ